jgi:uncharacterized protein (TIGR02597 family)
MSQSQALIHSTEHPSELKICGSKQHFYFLRIHKNFFKSPFPTNKRPQPHPVMKKYLPYSLILAAAATGMAQAATAFTTPVGYVTLAVPPTGDTNIGQPLQRPSAFSGSASSISGATVGIASNSLTADQFVFSSPSQTNSYYLRVTNGSLAGRTFEVLSNTANSITVDTNIQALGFSSTTTFSITPYWSLNTLFPQGAGVGASVDELEPVAFVSFVDFSAPGANKSAAATYFYYEGVGLNGSGWYNNDNTAAGKQDNLTIEPFQIAIIRNLENTPKSVTIAGSVPSTPTESLVFGKTSVNDSYFAVQMPIDITLGQSGLIASGAVTTSTDELEPVDLVSVYDETASQFNKAAATTYFHYTGTGLAGTGWYNNDNTAAGKQDNAISLKAGRQILIRKSALGAPAVVPNITPLAYSLQ